MATILITGINQRASQIDSIDTPITSISNISQTTIIQDLSPTTQDIKASNNPEFSIASGERLSVVTAVLPFRIRFTNLTVPVASFADVPGLGLQVIGLNNYIL